jgi:arylsulfatase A-like enzyme
MQVNYTAPHWPWEGPDDRDVSQKVTEALKENPLTALFHYEGGSLETYQKMVKALDDGVQKILDALKDKNIDENTIVIFSSDNGGERYAFMWPFVGEKGVLTEGGIRVPLIIKWPKYVKPGQFTDIPTVTMDITATMLDIAGVTPHEDYPLDGRSILPWLLDGQEMPERYLRWRIRAQGAIRKGKYKLLVEHNPPFKFGRPQGPAIQLFDVTEDGREAADLSKELPEITAELLAEWQRFDAELMPYPPRVLPPNAAPARAD